MAAFGLTWTVAYGLGPTWGGLVLERLGAPWLWSLTLLLGCAAALAYLPLRGRVPAAAAAHPR